MNVDKRTLLRVGGAIFLLYLCMRYWDGLALLFRSFVVALGPLILGFCVAYLVNILMSLYERNLFPKTAGRVGRAVKRPVSMLLAFTSLILILVGIIWLIVPELISCIQLLGMEIPKAWTRMLAWVENNLDAERWAQIESFLGNTTWDWQGIMKKAMDFLVSGFGGMMGTMTAVLTRTFSTLVTLLVGGIFAIYILSGKERLCGQLSRTAAHYLKPSWYHKLCHVLQVLHESFRRFIVGQCTEAVILGLLCTLGMQLLRFPYGNMVGALVGFTALIPVAGAYIGAGVGAFMIFTVSPLQSLFFLIFIVVLQQVEGNVVYPRVVGASIGLPGIWVLAAITVGGAMLGIGGMLLGVPLAATAYQLLRDDMGAQTLRNTK